ncbi:MAG: GIY-YIG nuclease family protein [Calditrichaceae bacterium]|jgi:putative endonuclease
MQKLYYVYVLKSLKDSRRYIGFTEDLNRRLNEHNNGLVKSTQRRRPLKLIYFEEFEDKLDAMQREKFFKTGKGREFLNSVVTE